MSDTPHTPDEGTDQPEASIDTGIETQDESPETPDHVSQDCAKAPLNPRWSLKLWIITIFVIGFGGLGVYDALIKYPARGQRHADWAKWQYLEASKAAESGPGGFGVFRNESSVPDPVAEYERLGQLDKRSTNQLRATMQSTRYDWLKSLKTIGQMTPVNTTIESPEDDLSELKARWTSATSNPKPLKGYDIPSQWAIMVVCWGVGAWMLLHILKVMGQKFSWDADTMALTVPGSIAITPENLEEVDKRKWDKFIVFLKLNSTHPTHAGKEIKVDTYQHNLVEDWILAMERKIDGSQEAGE